MTATIRVTENGQTTIKVVEALAEDLANVSDITRDLIPAADVTYSLGTAEKRWADLYVGNNTIYIGDNTRFSGTSLVIDGGENPASLTDMPTMVASKLVAKPFSYNPGTGPVTVRPSIEFQAADGTSYPISFDTSTNTFSLDAAGNHGTGSLVAKKITLGNTDASGVALRVTDGAVRFDGSTTIGYDSSDTLVVKATATFEGPVSFTNGAAIGDGNDALSINAGASNPLTITSSTLTVASNGNVTVGANLNVQGNLTISGTTTTIDSNTVNIGDNILVLNSDIPGGQDPSENAGIQIARGTEAAARWLWDEANDHWTPMGGSIGNVGALSATTIAASGGMSINGAAVATTAYVDQAVAGGGAGNLDGDLSAIAALTGTGYLQRAGTDTWTLSGTIPWSHLNNRPTTISGFGITNAYTMTEVDAALDLKAGLASATFTGDVQVSNGGRLGVGVAAEQPVEISDGTTNVHLRTAGGVGYLGATNSARTAYDDLVISGSTVALAIGTTTRLAVSGDGSVSVGGSAGNENMLVYGSGSAGRTRLRGAAPTLELYDTSAGTNQKSWRMITSGGTLYIQTVNDAYAAVLATTVSISRDGRVMIGGLEGSESLRVLPVSGSNRSVTVSGSNGGRPALGTTAGDLLVSSATGNVQVGRGAYLGSSASGNIGIGVSGGSQIGFLRSGDNDYLEFYVHKTGVHHKVALRLDEDGDATFTGSVNVIGDLSVTGSIVGGGAGMTTTEVTSTTQAMLANTVYVVNNAATVSLTLPSSAALGSVIEVIGKGAGAWRIEQNAGQSIRFANNQTTDAGVGAGLISTQVGTCIRLVCTTANTGWTVVSERGAYASFQTDTDWGTFTGSANGMTTTLAARGDGVRVVKINSTYQFAVFNNGTNVVGTVLTVAGTSVTMSAEQSFGATNMNMNYHAYGVLDASDLSAVKIFQAFATDPNTQFYARVITVNCMTGAVNLGSAVHFHSATYESRNVELVVLTSSKAVVQTGGAFTNPRLHGFTISGTTPTVTNSLEVGAVGGFCKLDSASVLWAATPYGGSNHQILQVYDFSGSTLVASGSPVNNGTNLMRTIFLSDGKAVLSSSNGGTSSENVRVVNVNSSDVISLGTQNTQNSFAYGNSFGLTANAHMALRISGNNIIGHVGSWSSADVYTDRSDVTLYSGSGSSYPSLGISMIDANTALLYFQDQTSGPFKVRVLKRA